MLFVISPRARLKQIMMLHISSLCYIVFKRVHNRHLYDQRKQEAQGLGLYGSVLLRPMRREQSAG